jgi:hypothetical protein
LEGEKPKDSLCCIKSVRPYMSVFHHALPAHFFSLSRLC